jgi:hypothetical protein
VHTIVQRRTNSFVVVLTGLRPFHDEFVPHWTIAYVKTEVGQCVADDLAQAMKEAGTFDSRMFAKCDGVAIHKYKGQKLCSIPLEPLVDSGLVGSLPLRPSRRAASKPREESSAAV